MSHEEPDAELAEEIESVFSREKFAEVRITVRLPAECMPNGEPVVFNHNRLIFADAVRMEDPCAVLPKELERVMRLIEMSLRFR